MPNHIRNKLTIMGKKKDIEKCLREIAGTYDGKYDDGGVRRIDFRKIIPMPEEIANTESPNRDEELAKELKKKYGHSDWYEWSCANWGTKWNTYNIEEEEYDEPNAITFDTAWSSPRPVIFELSKKYPSLEFGVIYADEDWGCNYGTYMYANGEIIEDCRYDVRSGDPDDIVRELQGAPWYEEEGYSSYEEWEKAQKEGEENE